MQKRNVMMIVVAVGFILTGCGAVFHQEGKHEPATQKMEKNVKPPVSYDNQIDLILKNKDLWCYTAPSDAAETEGMFATEADYYYRVSDMDKNGRLEITSSTTTGNGSIYYNTYFEVSEDGQELEKLSVNTSDSGEVPEPDLWDFVGYAPVYYDKKTGYYHYPENDHTHGSAVDTMDLQEDMVLSDGVVTVDTICGVASTGYKQKMVTEYYVGALAEKIGETTYTYHKDWEADDSEQDKQYTEEMDALLEQYYQEMEEMIVTFRWFCSINEDSYFHKSKVQPISDKVLREKIQDSWNSFGIHNMEDISGKIDNPYFPADFTKDTEVDFQVDMLTVGKATMKIQMEQAGKQGMLYAVSWHNPCKCSDKELGHVSKSHKRSIKERLEECSFYLWVTDKQIFYIPSYYDYERVDEDEHKIMRLLFYNEIPEYALLVCQEEELADSLEEMEVGEHQWIEKHEGDIRCYRSYTSRGEGYDTSEIFQFVWKKGIGLIGMRSAAHPAGGYSTFLWRESYLQLEDVAFSIDE